MDMMMVLAYKPSFMVCLHQLVNGASVETLSVYFSKRAPPPELPYHCFDEPWVPRDMPGTLEQVVMRMYHDDKATFTTHISSLRPRKVQGQQPSQISSAHQDLSVLALPEPGSHGVDYEFKWTHYGSQVFIRGTFTGWRDELMTYDPDTREHRMRRAMAPGIHLYCFRINKHLRVDMQKPSIGSGSRRRNILVVSLTIVFHYRHDMTNKLTLMCFDLSYRFGTLFDMQGRLRSQIRLIWLSRTSVILVSASCLPPSS